MDPTARRVLQSLRAAGVRRVPRPARRAPGPSGPDPGSATAVAPPERRLQTETAAPPHAAAEAAAELAAVAAEVERCQACKLCSTRQRTVPGEGSPNATIVFVGEGPGADEDRSGRPFVGRAGRLLDDIITKGMGLRRQDVFICNVVKCRPPGNRNPAPDEAAACAAFLERQLLAIAPRVICCLGACASRLLLQTDQPVGRLRGRVSNWRGIAVIPTYHPAYLLRNPAAKVPTWADIQKVMELAKQP